MSAAPDSPPFGLVADGGEMTLAECPPGPFLFNGSLGFRTEYGAMRVTGPVDVPGDQIRWSVSRWPDAYCLDSGEFFWGGVVTHEDRARLLVQPLIAIAGAQHDGVPA